MPLSKCVSTEKVYDLTCCLSFSKRRRLVNRLAKPFIAYYKKPIGVNIKGEYDDIVVKHALDLFNGNQTRAAAWLNMSQSRLPRRGFYEFSQ